jgi:hypothetical protein
MPAMFRLHIACFHCHKRKILANSTLTSPAITAPIRQLWSQIPLDSFLSLKQNHRQTCSTVRHGPRQLKVHRTFKISQTMDLPTQENRRSSFSLLATLRPEEPGCWRMRKPTRQTGQPAPESSTLQPRVDRPCHEPFRLDRTFRCHNYHKYPLWMSQVTLPPSGMDLRPLPWSEWTPASCWTRTSTPHLRCTGQTTPSM